MLSERAKHTRATYFLPLRSSLLVPPPFPLTSLSLLTLLPTHSFTLPLYSLLRHRIIHLDLFLLITPSLYFLSRYHPLFLIYAPLSLFSYPDQFPFPLFLSLYFPLPLSICRYIPPSSYPPSSDFSFSPHSYFPLLYSSLALFPCLSRCSLVSPAVPFFLPLSPSLSLCPLLSPSVPFSLSICSLVSPSVPLSLPLFPSLSSQYLYFCFRLPSAPCFTSLSFPLPLFHLFFHASFTHCLPPFVLLSLTL